MLSNAFSKNFWRDSSAGAQRKRGSFYSAHFLLTSSQDANNIEKQMLTGRFRLGIENIII